MQYTPYTLQNFRNIPQIDRLSEEQKQSIEVVGSVLPFRANNYVTDELIDWERVPDDPLFITTFPQRGMLLPDDYRKIEDLYLAGADREAIRRAADEIRLKLNPHPAGQIEHNVPVIDDQTFHGIQHKYRETALFFPAQGQTCHAFCTFCFRWPQFTGMTELKIASKEADQLSRYLTEHTEVTDILFTGGDPLVMKTHLLASYIEPLLAPEFSQPDDTHRHEDADLLAVPVCDRQRRRRSAFPVRRIRESGKHLASWPSSIIPAELKTGAVREAIRRIQQAGAVIRTQSPLLRHINDSPEIGQRCAQAGTT
jgi:L-lysine 2,3-aminomutase